MIWTVEFFEDDQGRQPVREWLDSLDSLKWASAVAAIEVILAERGLDVCSTEYGKQLGSGLFEFRIRHDEAVIRGKVGEGRKGERGEVLLRIFCHAYGEKIVLLLGGYDKGIDPSTRRQSREIDAARTRLRSFRLRQKRERAAAKRRS